MSATIGLIGYPPLNLLFEQVRYPFPAGVKLKIMSAVLEEAFAMAKPLEESGEVDVFVSAGGNYKLLSQRLKSPLVEVRVTGFDFLLALAKASQIAHKIALITYNKPLPYLDQVSHLLAIPVHQAIYNSVEEMDQVLAELKQQGIEVCIGASLTCKKAEAIGMSAVFIYSEDGIQRAMEAAVKIALTKRYEMAKAKELQTIIDFAYEGIAATNADGIITVFNPIAEKVTGIAATTALGTDAEKVLPNSRLQDVIKSGVPEINQIQSIGEVKILTNRIPIMVHDEVIGSVATFKNVDMIQEAEEKIREKLYLKGFVAKNTFGNILGESAAIAEIKRECARYAQSESNVLIQGESGTGKELFAQAIHNGSQRARRQFVAINCAALPPNLLESELFGYEEGAFTGAKKGGKRGLFELAHGGTIFLDEIGEMPTDIQSRLLRVLEEHEVLRIGGEKIIPVNIRVIAATNKNLWSLVEQAKFRGDLYYRLCVLEVTLPPLRERKRDIPLLVEKFLGQFCTDLSQTTVEQIAKHPGFTEYSWPGNIRELRNWVERCAVLYDAQDDQRSLGQLFAKLLRGKSTVTEQKLEERALIELLAEMKGNKAAAAKKLGVSRTTLWRKLRQYDL